jgi:hypothetical protein
VLSAENLPTNILNIHSRRQADHSFPEINMRMASIPISRLGTPDTARQKQRS